MISQSLRDQSNHERKQHQKLQIAITILFSIVTIALSFTQIAYVPISSDNVVDITIVGFVFAAMIGGHKFGIPLAMIWSVSSYYNLPLEYSHWALWELMLVRVIFAVSIVLTYDLAKKWHKQSPLNVYRAIIAGVTIKAVSGLPSELVHSGFPEALLITAEAMILEIALCILFMSLLIKHLRQIHLLNGVRKRERGERKDASQEAVS